MVVILTLFLKTKALYMVETLAYFRFQQVGRSLALQTENGYRFVILTAIRQETALMEVILRRATPILEHSSRMFTVPVLQIQMELHGYLLTNFSWIRR